MFGAIAGAVGAVVNAVVETAENVITGGSPPPNVPPACEGGECPDAVQAARVAHGDQKKACAAARTNLWLIEQAVSLATPSLMQAVLLLILFLLLFGPFGIIVAGIGYLILLLFIRAWSPVAAAAVEALAIAEGNLRDAVARVVTTCSADCIAALEDEIRTFTPCDAVDPTSLLAGLPFNNQLGFSNAFSRRSG